MSTTVSKIPLFPDTPLYSIRVTLSGAEYVLQFDYNGRQDRWYLHILAIDNTRIVSNMKAVCNWDILRKCVHPLRPPGYLFFLDPQRRDAEPPGFSDLGRRVSLWYVVRVADAPAKITKAVVPS